MYKVDYNCTTIIKLMDSGTKASRKAALAEHWDYLNKSNANLISNVDFSQFMQTLENKYSAMKTYYIVLSPKSPDVDMTWLTNEFLEILKKEKLKGRPCKDYFAIQHNDTDNPHVHLVIPSHSHYCSLKLDGAYYLSINRKLSKAIKQKYGELSPEVEMKNYAQSTDEKRVTRIDADIKRIAIKTESNDFYVLPTSQIVELHAEKKIPENDYWKIPFINKRIETLQEMGLAHQNQSGEVLIQKGFVHELVNMQRLYDLAPEINYEAVTFVTYVKKSDIKTVIATKTERDKVQTLVMTHDGQLKYFARTPGKPKNKIETRGNSAKSILTYLKESGELDSLNQLQTSSQIIRQPARERERILGD